jgi:hypothetical protein
VCHVVGEGTHPSVSLSARTHGYSFSEDALESNYLTAHFLSASRRIHPLMNSYQRLPNLVLASPVAINDQRSGSADESSNVITFDGQRGSSTALRRP